MHRGTARSAQSCLGRLGADVVAPPILITIIIPGQNRTYIGICTAVADLVTESIINLSAARREHSPQSASPRA